MPSYLPTRSVASPREREEERDRQQARRGGWNDAIETAARMLEEEVGNRQEIDARARSVRSLKK